MAFFNIFLKTLGLLFGIAVFFTILSLLFGLIPNEKNIFKFKEGNKNSDNIIAIIDINGPILNKTNNTLIGSFLNTIDPIFIKEHLKNLEEIDPKVLIFKINSPGGTVTATYKLENLITKFKNRNEIEIYFYSDEMLASGGYWVATAGDKIFANYGSIIGSIGVSGPSWYFYDRPVSFSNKILGQNIETEGGIKIFNQNAGNSKDLYNPFRKPTIKEMNHLQGLIDDIYDDFLTKVSKSRKIERGTLKNDIGALIFSSNQAKEKFLIDDIIDFDLLIKKIIKEKKFKDYKVINIKNNENIMSSYFINLFNFNNSYLCKKFNSAIVSVLPNFLGNCYLY